MRYENRQVPEGINVSEKNHLLTAIKLGVVALLLVVALISLFYFFGSQIARFVPYRYERSLADNFGQYFPDDAKKPLQQYLDGLAERLQAHMDIPDGFEISIHYSDSEVFNAYAHIGGHLIFTRGLLERMPSEDALATVVAHEIAHATHRHAFSAMTGGASGLLLLQLVTGQAGTEGVAGILSTTGQLTSMSFSRKMESQADEAALKAIAAEYGHVGGARQLFDAFLLKELEAGSGRERPDTGPLDEFVSTHPLTESRVESVYRLAEENGWSTDTRDVTPLPTDLNTWL